MPAKIAIGQDDFVRLRQEGSEFVDKTRMIQTLLDEHAVVTLLPRPRRFGKTLKTGSCIFSDLLWCSDEGECFPL